MYWLSDYRGYGQSKFARPSEARWREDAESALRYLTATRHIAANSIVLVGRDLEPISLSRWLRHTLNWPA